MRRMIEVVAVVVVLIGLMSSLILLPDTQDFTKYNVLIETLTLTPFGISGTVGSGVVISRDGLIVTAAHVLCDASTVRITLHDGRVFDVNDFYVDDELDIGFIDLSCAVRDYITLSDHRVVEKNCTIVGVGNPGGIKTDITIKGQLCNNQFRRLVLHKTISFLLAIMPVEPGFSGGGVYANDELVGIKIIKIDEFAIMVPSDVCLQALERYSAQ